MANLIVLMATHNRREVTARCLRALLLSAEAAQSTIDLVVFDDGSSDGTVESVRSLVPSATVLEGDGRQFWAASMSAAETVARSFAGADSVLVWLNDDVALDTDALARMSEVLDSAPGRVLVGSVREPLTGVLSYGGLRRRGRHPLSFRLVPPPSQGTVALDSLNGNFVAVPMSVVARLGGIESRFAHAGADIEFGLRLRNAGEPALLLPGTFGVCATNPPVPRGGFISDWRRFTSRKGGGHPATLRLLLRRASRFPNIWLALTYANWVRKRMLGRR